MGNDTETLAQLKVKAIKNGRLTMFSVFGSYVQVIVTGEGPVENWLLHMADPFSANGFTIGGADKITSTLLSYSPSRVAVVTATSCKLLTWYRPERNKWLGPSSAGAVPEWLTGEHHGDYGCNTAGLVAALVTFERYHEAELVHTRWAMLGTLGCLTLELLGKAGFPIAEPVLFKAGFWVFWGYILCLCCTALG